MSLSIRRIMPDEVPLMASLLTTFGDVFDDADAYSGNRPSANYMRRLLGGDSFIAVAALKEGSVVGGLAAYELKRIAATRGAYVIFVQADTGTEDAPAIALYTKLGTREDVLHFDIAVDGGAQGKQR
jgi:aminoglycoside 3-N-acetyltransferase I